MSSTDTPDPPQTLASPPSPVHSDDIWMKDGNFILRALPSDENTMLTFKVHKSVLATHATFFRDLFGGPQDAALEASSQQYEGLPVMDTQDAENDLDDFLHAMYYPTHMNRHRLSSKYGLLRSNFPKMYRGILELSRKYDAQGIREVVVSAIQEQWPSQLWQWDEREAAIPKTFKTSAKNVTPFYPDPAETIRSGMQYNIPSILPVAFYDLTRVLEFGTSQGGIDRSRTSDLDPLSCDDLKRFIHGRASLRTRLLALNPKPARNTSCTATTTAGRLGQTTSQCVSQVQLFWVKHFVHVTQSRDPWAELLKSSDFPKETIICDKCRPILVAEVARKREILWEELPDLFNLREYVGSDWGKSST
ncbi:hypothetical protein OF83DRAFT_1133646 [Amylostereum chailletii]|nr:hypothetical protein OF83DRAFT_1133646 [Amylostereum chailletii]